MTREENTRAEERSAVTIWQQLVAWINLWLKTFRFDKVGSDHLREWVVLKAHAAVDQCEQGNRCVTDVGAKDDRQEDSLAIYDDIQSGCMKQQIAAEWFGMTSAYSAGGWFQDKT